MGNRAWWLVLSLTLACKGQKAEPPGAGAKSPSEATGRVASGASATRTPSSAGAGAPRVLAPPSKVLDAPRLAPGQAIPGPQFPGGPPTVLNARSANMLSSNAASRNAASRNAASRNAASRNAVSRNAVSRNAVSRNAVSRNAVSRNTLAASTNLDLAANGVDGANGVNDIYEALSNADPALNEDGTPIVDRFGTPQTEGMLSRQFMAYLVGCALRTDQSVQFDWTEAGQTQSATWQGWHGLCPEWADGPPSETCQRWVTACILARTNRWGTPVDISIRGNHPALATTPEEVSETRTICAPRAGTSAHTR